MKMAYMIAAHNELKLLEKLLQMLDHEDNDIYLHVDIKNKEYQEDYFKNVVHKARIFFVTRLNVAWGGYTQIVMELTLLKAATQEHHDYYHYISGVDFPIKSREWLVDFLEREKGKEFIHFDYETHQEEVKARIDQYHIFQEKIGRTRGALQKFEKCLIALQKLVGVRRTKNFDFEVKKGANWFSVTEECAKFVISKEDFIYKSFSCGCCSDELFLQTVVYNSEFRDRLFYSERQKRNYNMRHLDWKRGNPYVFQLSDFDELMDAEEFFARKFSLEKDAAIIEKLEETIGK